MPLITSKIQNLLNGVSQQADTQRYPSQGDEQINMHSSPVDGLLKRNPSVHIAKQFDTNSGTSDTYSHVINRDSTENYSVAVRSSEKKTITLDTSGDLINCTSHPFVAGDEVRFHGSDLGSLNQTDRYYVVNPATNTFQVATTSGGSAVTISDAGTGTQNVSLDPISVIDLLNGTSATVTTTNGCDYLINATPSTVFETTTIADYTFIVNNTVTVAEDSATYTNPDYRAYVYIRQGDYGTKYTVIYNGTEYTHTTADGDASTERPQIDTEYIATQLKTTIDAGSETGLTVTRVGSTLELSNSTDFTVSVKDGLGDTAMGVVKEEADGFTSLPAYCRDGRRVKVIGDVDSNADDYYVKFTAEDPSNAPFGGGTWAESVGTGVPYSLDSSTMPHTLVRNADGSFTLDRATWANRNAGDSLSAPAPSFVGAKIKGIVLFRDRLGFLSGENVSLSEAGEYFNFYRTTLTSILGADPLDVRASHNQVSNLHSAIPFNRNLILFSDRTQFMLTGGDVLSPDTISISQETEYDSDTNTVPVVSGKNVYFPFARGSYSGIMEYYISPETEQMEGSDVTAHVPKYIDGNITRISSNSNDPLLVVTSSSYTTGVYVYAYYSSGNKKVQASWSKFDFGSDATVRSADFIGKDLYVSVKRNDGLFVERVSFRLGESDSDSDFTVRLDRRITEATSGVALSFDSDTGRTTITLPFSASGTMQVVSRAVSGVENGGAVFKIHQQSGSTLVVEGDLQTRKFFIGEKYTSSFTLSKPTLKEQSEGGGSGSVASGRYQIRNGTLTFDNSVSFKIEVTPEGRSTRTHVFDSRKSGSFVVGAAPTVADGTFKFPVQSKGETTSIKLINDTPFPSSFLTVEYEALYYARSQRAG